MENFEDYALRIADYLENKMNPDEEKAFIKELGSNRDLRQQFEEGLLIAGLLKEDVLTEENGTIMFQPADEHLSMMEAVLRKPDELNSQPVIIPFYKRTRNIAAVFVLVIMGFGLYFVFHKKVNDGNNIVRGQAPADTINQPVPRRKSGTGIDTAKQDVQLSKAGEKQFKTNDTAIKSSVFSDSTYRDNAPYLNDQAKILRVYNKYHSTYNGENDPVEISNYYNLYKKGKYQEVLTAKESDYQVMGSGDRKDLLKQYMNLYKGLCLLDAGKAQAAIGEFDKVLQSASKAGVLYHVAQWYGALASLKNGDPEKSISILNAIINSKSPFISKASGLKRDLGLK